MNKDPTTGRAQSRLALQCIAFIALCAASATATSSCYQWIGNVPGQSFENSPQQAANDIVAWCNANPLSSGSCNTPVPCGGGYTCTFSATTQAFPAWPYFAANVTGVANDGHGSVLTGTGVDGISTKNNCKIYVSANGSPSAQGGNNRVGDPIDPASGAMTSAETDLRDATGTVPFRRFYNSSSGAGPLTVWRSSFLRSIAPRYAGNSYSGPYLATLYNSSLYNDEASACTSGFAEIQGRVSAWASAAASYANGVCSLSTGGSSNGTLPLIYSDPSVPDPINQPLIGYDAIRDDGQVVSFQLQGNTLTAPTGTVLRLQMSGSGFTLIDETDSTESYNTSGRLLSVTSRAGLVQTMGYDAAGRLSTVTDSFGHIWTMSYDSQGRPLSVTKQ